MWTVREHKTVPKVIPRAPRQVQVNYVAWKRIVELQGPHGLRAVKGFHDEKLKGEWKGYRSSRLSFQWRVIYTVEERALAVWVVEVTPHRY